MKLDENTYKLIVQILNTRITKIFFLIIISNLITAYIVFNLIANFELQTPIEKFLIRTKQKNNFFHLNPTSIEELTYRRTNVRVNSISTILANIEQRIQAGGDILFVIDEFKNIVNRNKILLNENYLDLFRNLPDDHFMYEVVYDDGEKKTVGVIILDRKGNVLRDLITGEFESK